MDLLMLVLIIFILSGTHGCSIDINRERTDKLEQRVEKLEERDKKCEYKI